MIINNTPFVTDLSDILNELQLQLVANHIPLLSKMKDTPDNIMVTCPYHKGGQEIKPSAGIKKSDGTFHCFTCGETHSLQEVISYCFGKYDDVFGAFGWNWLLKNFLTINVEERKDVVLDYSRDNMCVARAINYVSEEELDSYREYHPYMWQRKMTPEVVEIFDVGYDKATQCLTFPVRDIHGRTLFIARRSVNSKFFNYPAGAEKPVYGLYELDLCDYPEGYEDYDGCWHEVSNYPSEVIICESIIDAITCWVYGKRAVALNGLGNELQFRQLNEMPCRKFILATDNDDAGQKARQRIKKNIHNKLITQYVLPTNRKDINELSKEEFDNLQEIF